MSTDTDAVDERTQRALVDDEVSAEDLDEGTPESDADPESDASDVEEDDAPGTVAPLVAAGPVAPDGKAHRRRRSDPPEHPPADEAERPRPRIGWIITAAALLLLLILSVLLNWHLWSTTDDWEARADQLTEVNYDLGEQLAREEQTTMQLESEIELLSQQLATSNQTVVDLSAQVASAGDQSEFATQQIDQLTASLTDASGVANALNRCVDGQQQLITYLQEPDNFDPDELEDFSTSVDQLCVAAESSNERLREALAE